MQEFKKNAKRGFGQIWPYLQKWDKTKRLVLELGEKARASSREKKRKREEKKKMRRRREEEEEKKSKVWNYVWNFVWNLLGFVWIFVWRFRIPLFV